MCQNEINEDISNDIYHQMKCAFQWMQEKKEALLARLQDNHEKKRFERVARKAEFHFDEWFCFLCILTDSEIHFRMHAKSYNVDKLSETEYHTDKSCAI